MKVKTNMNDIFENITEWFHDLFEEKIMSQKLLWGILFFLLLSFLLIVDLIPGEFDFKPGERSPTDITAPRSATFVDEERTEELQRIAAETAQKVYIKEEQIENEVQQEINDFFDDIQQKKAVLIEISEEKSDNGIEETDRENTDQKLDRQQILEQLQQEYEINRGIIDVYLDFSREKLEELLIIAGEVIEKQYQDWILSEDLPEVKAELKESINDYELDDEAEKALVNLLTEKIRPNMFLDAEETEQRRQQAMARVQPYRLTIERGEMIVRKGDIITEQDLKILGNLGLTRPQVNIFNIAGIILIVFISILLIAFYFWKYEQEIWSDNKKLLLMELLVIIVAVLAKVIDLFQEHYLMYLTPIALISILITILIKKEHVALIVTIFICFIIGLIFNNSFEVALLGFYGGLVGIFSASKLTQRSDLVRAGFNVSGILLILIIGLNFIRPGEGLQNLVKTGSMGLLNGVLVAVLANGFLPYLENSFGLTSSVKLLELSNPSHPLLKRLLVEAPGTYHHSVIVGNLAETAADNIGADSLLTRVAAYYHDIGKLKRPYFFTDNQFGGKNPHEDISANLSSLIIKSHVKDGVELAEKENLPEPVINILQQHHGENLISYFYQQAQEEEKYENIEEAEFCYDGPKPKTKEAAIVMLADVVEAAVRSKQFDKSDHNRIEAMVNELIQKLLVNSQLEESELTFKELSIIGESFVKVLTGIYHQRVEYPEQLINEMDKDDNNGES